MLLEPEMVGRSGSDAYGWAPGKYYAVAAYAADGVVSRCGKVREKVVILVVATDRQQRTHGRILMLNLSSLETSCHWVESHSVRCAFSPPSANIRKYFC